MKAVRPNSRYRHGAALLASLAAASLVLAATTAPAAASVNNKKEFAALEGKRLPGTSTAWSRLSGSFFDAHPTDVAGTISPPLATANVKNGVTYEPSAVAFFNFKTSNEAMKFYGAPPLADYEHLFVFGALPQQALLPLAGATGLSIPARGYALVECGQSSGPACGTSCRSSSCSPGPFGDMRADALFIGVDTLFRRGNVVVMVQSMKSSSLAALQNSVTAPGGGLEDGYAVVGTTYSALLSANTKYALSALKLMKKVHLT
jgi:hypothetical protein